MGTYWTTLITNDAVVAMQMLALPRAPRYRIGGLSIDEIDPRMIRRFDRAAPAYHQPGGAEEILIEGAIPIMSIFDLTNGRTIHSILK
jgi:hypothetical protein